MFGFGLRPEYRRSDLVLKSPTATLFPRTIGEARALRTADKRLVYFEVTRWIFWPAAATLISMKTHQEFAIDYFQDEDGMFTARVPAIKGCLAWGKTLDETYHHAVEAIESCLEAREKVAARKLRKLRYTGLNIYRRPVHA